MNSSIFILYLTLAGVLSFNITFNNTITELADLCTKVNTTYECINLVGEQVYSLMSQSGVLAIFLHSIQLFFSFASGLLVNPHIIGVVALFAVGYYLLRLIWPFLTLSFKLARCSVSPCVACVRSRYIAPKRRGLFAQGDEGGAPESNEFARSGTSQTPSAPLAASPAAAVPVRSDITAPSVVEAAASPDESVASNPQDMIQCNQHRNTLFSGVMRPVITWKTRKFPSYELMYKQKGGEYDLMAEVATFTWPTSSLVGASVYSNSISSLVVSHPRFKFLRSLWTYYRFGVRIIVAPTCNSFASGIMAAFITPSAVGSTNPLVNIGLVPHGFIQPSSNDHVTFELPFVGVDHWMNLTGDTASTIFSPIPWTISFVTMSPLQVPTGGPTSLNYTLYMQLTDVHARWPQAVGAAVQGLFNFNNISIGSLKDSTLPLNLAGDTTSVSIPAFGFDHPTNNRNPDRMIRRVFQVTHHSKGGLEAMRSNFNGSSMEPSLWKGQDEMSIPWLASRPILNFNFKLNTSQTVGQLVWTIPFPPQAINTSETQDIMIDTILANQLAFECEEFVFRFYIPKTPYQNGKYLAVATLGIIPPNVLTNGTLSMSAAPSMIIDLASPELIHEFKVPWMTLREYYPSPNIAALEAYQVPNLTLYALNPMTTNLATPNNITCWLGYHYTGLRMLEPVNLNMVAQGEPDQQSCRTNVGKISLRPDTVMTATVDDVRSLKQYWLTPHKWFSGAGISTGGTEIAWEWDTLISTFAFANLYRVYSGSIRFHFTFSRWTGTEHVILTFDKLNRNNSKTQPGTTPLMDAVFWNPINTLSSVNYPSSAQANFAAQSSTFVCNGATSFMIKVDNAEKEVTVDIPIVCPRGFDYVGDFVKWGSSVFILPVGPLPSLAVAVCISVGDDFEAHLLSNEINKISSNAIFNVGGTYPSIY